MLVLWLIGCIAGPLGSVHPPETLEPGSFRLGVDGGVYTARRSLGWVYPGSGTGYQGRAYMDFPSGGADLRVGAGAWTAGRPETWGVTGGFLSVDAKQPLTSGERRAGFVGLDLVIVTAAASASDSGEEASVVQDGDVFLRAGVVLASADADVPRLVVEPVVRAGLISIEGELNARVALLFGRVSLDPGGFVHCGAEVAVADAGRAGCIGGGSIALTARGGR